MKTQIISVYFCGEPLESSDHDESTCKYCTLANAYPSQAYNELTNVLMDMCRQLEEKIKYLERTLEMNIEPFTEDTVRKHSEELTINHLSREATGLVDFFHTFIKKDGKTSYTCTDKSWRNTFQRYIGSNIWMRDQHGDFIEKAIQQLVPIATQLKKKALKIRNYDASACADSIISGGRTPLVKRIINLLKQGSIYND